MPTKGQIPSERVYSHERYYARGSKGTPRPWALEDEAEILLMARPDRELSAKLDRSIRAIQVKRCKLIAEGRTR